MTHKIVLCTILLLSMLANGSAFAHKKVIVVDKDRKVVKIKKRGHHADRVIIVRDRRPDNVIIVEKPVVVRKVVERPVIVREVVETPVIVREVVERPVIVREVVETPVIVYEQHVVVNRPVVVPSVSYATLGFSVPFRIGRLPVTVSFSSTSCSTNRFED